jgi:hypothetical protein
MEDTGKKEAQTIAAPLVDALSQIFHSSNKLNNGLNAIEERIGKLEQEQKETSVGEKKTISIIGDIGSELGLVEEDTTMLDTKLNATIAIARGVLDDLSKRLAQMSVDLGSQVTSVKFHRLKKD